MTMQGASPQSLTDAMKDAVNRAIDDAMKSKEKLLESCGNIGSLQSQFVFTGSYPSFCFVAFHSILH